MQRFIIVHLLITTYVTLLIMFAAVYRVFIACEINENLLLLIKQTPAAAIVKKPDPLSGGHKVKFIQDKMVWIRQQ